MDEERTEVTYEFHSEYSYLIDEELPAAAVADDDQALAHTLDEIKNAKQFFVMTMGEPSDEGVDLSLLSKTHGNYIEIANFIFQAHKAFHLRIDQLVSCFPPQALAYFAHLRNGGGMTHPRAHDNG